MNPIVTLVLIACLHSAPHECKPAPVTLDPFKVAGNIFGCLGKVGQDAARKYEEDHPDYFVRQWACKFGVPDEEPA